MLITHRSYIYISLHDKKLLRIHLGKVFYILCLLIEGSGTGTGTYIDIKTEVIDIKNKIASLQYLSSKCTCTSCVAFVDDFIGPCRVQQRRGSRAHQRQQEVPGSTYPDHEVRAWKYPITPHWRGRRQGTGSTGPLPPSPPPPPSGQAGQRPPTPLHRTSPSPK